MERVARFFVALCGMEQEAIARFPSKYSSNITEFPENWPKNLNYAHSHPVLLCEYWSWFIEIAVGAYSPFCAIKPLQKKRAYDVIKRVAVKPCLFLHINLRNITVLIGPHRSVANLFSIRQTLQ